MIRAFKNLVALEFKEFFREPEIIFWAFVLPILLAWLLGIAIGSSNGLRRNVALIADSEECIASWQSWIDSVRAGLGNVHSQVPRGSGRASSDENIQFFILSEEDAARALKEGSVFMLVDRVPGGSSVRFSFDPRNEQANMTFLMIDRALHGADPVDTSIVRPLTLQGTRYIDFLVPGLLAMDIMSSAMWGIGWALIEIRIKKLLRRMAATPMSKSMFLCSHFVTRLLVNSVEFIALFIFAHLYFGVRIQGSIAALAAVFVAGNAAFAGIAIFVSSRTANPRVGNGLINAVTFPMTLLSGVFFSYKQFPAWVQPIVKILPLTALTDSMRTVFNGGAGFSDVAFPIGVLAAIGLLFFSLGMRIYRWY